MNATSRSSLVRCALLNNGVDRSLNHGRISAVHTGEDVERMVAGSARAVRDGAVERAFEGCRGGAGGPRRSLSPARP